MSSALDLRGVTPTNRWYFRDLCRQTKIFIDDIGVLNESDGRAAEPPRVSWRLIAESYAAIAVVVSRR